MVFKLIMKKLKQYLIESQNFLVNKKLKNRQQQYEYHPNSTEELIDIIIELLNNGITDLNCIDVSEIDDMYDVFHKVNLKVTVRDIDISEWDVSNVKDMSFMFDYCTEFNADLSNWNVSNVEGASYMFNYCYEFNSDITKWKFNNLKHTEAMFNKCFNFDYDLSKWNVLKSTRTNSMFYDCDTLKKNNKIPNWYNGHL